MFFINDVLRFKYQPGHLKVNVGMISSVSSLQICVSDIYVTLTLLCADPRKLR
jgi:hypothetical protein